MDDEEIGRFIGQAVPDDVSEGAKERFRDLQSDPPMEGNAAETTIADSSCFCHRRTVSECSLIRCSTRYSISYGSAAFRSLYGAIGTVLSSSSAWQVLWQKIYHSGQ